MVRARPRERFSRTVTLTPDSASDFARAAGDENPVHHDESFAAGTRFGRRIASGTQTSSLLMSLTATHFSASGPMLGLDFSFRFKRPVYADEAIKLEWLIVAVRSSARLGGEVVELRGRLVNQAGETAVGAKGKVLLVDTL